MAALRFTLGPYGSAHQTAISSITDAAGEHTTSGTASFIKAGGVDIEATGRGQVFSCRPTGDVWLAFGGRTAAVGTTHFVASGERFVFAVKEPGKISVIDDS